VSSRLPTAKRPRLVRVVKAIPLTDGYRPRKSVLREQGVNVGLGETVLTYDERAEKYVATKAGSAVATA
jgi:hypothetical protein